MKYNERKSFINEYGAFNQDARQLQTEFGKLVKSFLNANGLLQCRLNEVEDILVSEITGYLSEERIRQAMHMKRADRAKNAGYFQDTKEPSCDSCLGQ